MMVTRRRKGLEWMRHPIEREEAGNTRAVDELRTAGKGRRGSPRFTWKDTDRYGSITVETGMGQ